MPSSHKFGSVAQLPDILKQYTKDCIRAQPADIIQWSTDYFQNLAIGGYRPGKSREERSSSLPPCKPTLTPGLLRALHAQVNGRLIVQSKEIEQKWNDLGLPPDILRRIMTVGGFGVEIEWMKFFALGCSILDPNITNAMKYAFEILSSSEDGGRIPYTTFRFLYSYLAMIDGEIHRSQIEKMLNNIERQVAENDGLVRVSDFTNC
ncbi:ropporin-1-like isoform X1 [Chiloscyllium plagiosum]|uniref:ropporin-1-like isoform X1 n=1 Tax=Chiloscyllium plagiosum TaxID=36176 RepID=UPI001CB84F02|nr:ropporin-1-like isoform X1 [Chiloscyllium plagiosum]